MSNGYSYMPTEILSQIDSYIAPYELYTSRNLSSYWRNRYEDSLDVYINASPQAMQSAYKAIQQSPVLIIDLVRKFGFDGLSSLIPHFLHILYNTRMKSRRLPNNIRSYKNIVRGILSLDGGISYMSSLIDRLQANSILEVIDIILADDVFDPIIINWLTNGGMKKFIELSIENDDYSTLINVINKLEVMPDIEDRNRLLSVLDENEEEDMELIQLLTQ